MRMTAGIMQTLRAGMLGLALLLSGMTHADVSKDYLYLKRYTLHDILDVIVAQGNENRGKLQAMAKAGRVMAAERYADDNVIVIALHVPGMVEKSFTRPDTLRLYVFKDTGGKLQLLAQGWDQDDLLQGTGLLRLDVNSFKINSSEHVIGVYFEPLRPVTTQTHSQRALLLYRLKDNQAIPVVKTFHHRQFQAEITPSTVGTYLLRNDLSMKPTMTNGFYDIGSSLVVYEIDGASLTKVREENNDYRWDGSQYLKN